MVRFSLFGTSPSSINPLCWQTLVVNLTMIGCLNCSDSLKASMVMALTSAGFEGTNVGKQAAFPIVRRSISSAEL